MTALTRDELDRDTSLDEPLRRARAAYAEKCWPRPARPAAVALVQVIQMSMPLASDNATTHWRELK